MTPRVHVPHLIRRTLISGAILVPRMPRNPKVPYCTLKSSSTQSRELLQTSLFLVQVTSKVPLSDTSRNIHSQSPISLSLSLCHNNSSADIRTFPGEPPYITLLQASALHEPFVIPSQMPAQEGTRSFDPKDPPKLNPPKDDPISVEELAKCDGMRFQIAILRPGEQQLIDQTMQGLARIILRM